MKPSPKSTENRCWPAGWAARPIARGEEILNLEGIPTFPFPDTAARAFVDMWHYTYNLRLLYETPELAEIRTSIARPSTPCCYRPAHPDERC